MKQILIADDDESLRTINRMIVKRDFPDYEIEEFKDGTLLAGRLEQDVSNVCLVLTDNSMPGVNGSEIIKKYAKTSRFSKIPMILAYGDGESIGKKAIEDGAFDYILKPFRSLEFTALLKKAFDKYK